MVLWSASYSCCTKVCAGELSGVGGGKVLGCFVCSLEGEAGSLQQESHMLAHLGLPWTMVILPELEIISRG